MTGANPAPRPILRLSKAPPPKVAAMVAAMKPPPPPEPPPPALPTQAELSAAARLQRAEWRKADLALCREKFPGMFDPEHPKPLAIGIHIPLGKVIGLKRAKRLMGWWSDWRPYVVAIAAGGPRYNLDGTEAGSISERQRAFAQADIDGERPDSLVSAAELNARRADHQAAAEPQPQPEEEAA